MKEVTLFEIEEVDKRVGEEKPQRIVQNQSERVILLPQKPRAPQSNNNNSALPHYLADTQRSLLTGSPLKPPV